MNNLHYPYDLSEVLRKRKVIKRELLEKLPENSKVLKIAILGGGTVNIFGELLELYLLKQGCKCDFYYSDYNRYYEEVMFDTGSLWEFEADYIYIHTTVRNIEEFPLTGESLEDVNLKIHNQMSKFKQMWSKIKENSKAVIIQNNFELPKLRLLGNSAAVEQFGAVRFINRLNLALSDALYEEKNILLNDIHYLSSEFGLEKWFNESQWVNYKYAYEINATWKVASSASNLIMASLGKSKKCLVLDLDNTLWGGVIGDDGLGGIALGNESALGESFVNFQKYALSLKERGVILAVCSKNEMDNAKSGFTHVDSVLKFDDFIVFKASWETKEKMITEIAEELNIGLDSLVFIDDNPAERQIIQMGLPQISVPDVGDDILSYARHIDSNGYFESIKIVKEDLMKNQTYKENIKRVALEKSFINYDDYLLSLSMTAEIKAFDSANLDRIVQLINKTNQFNMTGLKADADKVSEYIQNPKYLTLQARLTDTFGDNGIVSLLMARAESDYLSIDLWVMSCRVFKRNLEHSIIDEVIKYCKSKNIKKIRGHYRATEKNKIVANLYLEFGFKKVDDEVFEFSIDSSAEPFNKVMTVIN